MMQHLVLGGFLFALGACVGSFLNVVVWRLPRGMSLIRPGSRCPACATPIRWHDNVPVLGWLWLRGRCRACGAAISPRYPIVEAATGALFVVMYVALFMGQWGPLAPEPMVRYDLEGRVFVWPHLRDLAHDWPVFFLYLLMVSALLAASLIDAELYIIPVSIPWFMAGAGLAVHAFWGAGHLAGSLRVGPALTAAAAGGAAGWALSVALLKLRVLPLSFAQGEPMLEVDRELAAKANAEAAARGEAPPPLPPVYTRGQVYREIAREIAFVAPALTLAGACFVAALRSPAAGAFWTKAASIDAVSGMAGAALGALVGAGVVWATRIAGTFAFGRVAMGLGDVHLMFGVGAIIGAGASVLAFFVAPFFGLAGVALRLLGRGRELPYGPYLSMASVAALLAYGEAAEALRPGVEGFVVVMRRWTGW